jgi:hypothetical protein
MIIKRSCAKVGDFETALGRVKTTAFGTGGRDRKVREYTNCDICFGCSSRCGRFSSDFQVSRYRKW